LFFGASLSGRAIRCNLFVPKSIFAAIPKPKQKAALFICKGYRHLLHFITAPFLQTMVLLAALRQQIMTITHPSKRI